MLEDAPTSVAPLLIWGPVVLFVAALVRSAAWREWTLAVNLRWLVFYHVVRAGVGAGFLLMSGRELPTEFALPAGVGDVAVGIGVLFVALLIPARTALRRRILLAWNTLGLLDMVNVFVTAQRIVIFGDDPDALVELTSFPMGVVPTFIVPMVLITHIAIYAHLWRMRGS